MEKENAFKKIVDHIFNNWTALNLAVEHSTSGVNGKEVVNGFMNYMVGYCLYEPNVDTDGIQEALDDIMDEEFDTICEDDSTKEIAIILHRFLELIRQGNVILFEEEYQKLAINSMSPPKHEKLKSKNMSDTCEASVNSTKHSTSSEVPMEEDSEWTEVKSRRKH